MSSKAKTTTTARKRKTVKASKPKTIKATPRTGPREPGTYRWHRDDWEETDAYVAFATNLSELRTEAGLSMRELGDLIGYTRPAISNMEVAAKRPDAKNRQGATLPTLLRLCWALKTTPDRLLRPVGK